MSHNPISFRDSRSQRGAASVAISMLLMFILAAAVLAVINMSGSSVIDAAKNEEQVAALFVAESGLERAAAILQPKIVSGTMADSDCTGIKPSTGNSFDVGSRGGRFSYLSAVPSPASCSSTGTPCTKCSVTVSGTVGSSARTVKLDIAVPIPAVGTSNCGTNVSLTLTNTTDYAATGVFSLAWRRQMNSGEYPPGCPSGGGGNANATTCPGNPGPECVMKWNVESSSGNPSGGSMGASIGIQPHDSFQVTQTLSTNRNFVEVGGLFPGFSTTIPPAIVGSYWDDSNGGNGTKTVNNSNNTPSAGLTNSGVATTGGSCLTPDPSHATNPKQTCTSWCNDLNGLNADTLVYGATGRSGAQADTITAVTFNTNGTPPQNILLTRIAHFPNTSGVPAATGDIYSEIWYAHNPSYLYGARTTGSIAINQNGALNFTATISNGSPTLQITSVVGGSGLLSVGDTINTVAGIPAGTRINAIVSGSGGVGFYTMSQNATADSTTTNVSTTRHILTVTAVNSGSVALGQTLSSTGGGQNVPAGTTIVAVGPVVGGNPTYFLNMATPQTVTSRIVTSGATSSGTTISVPNAGSLPPVGTPLTIVAVRSGTGQFAAQTTVNSVNAGNNTFTVSSAPTITLDGAQVCGGTCAFFDNPSSTTASSGFVVTRSAGTTQWASGFVCLSGVDQSKIVPVSNITPADYGKWAEVLR